MRGAPGTRPTARVTRSAGLEATAPESPARVGGAPELSGGARGGNAAGAGASPSTPRPRGHAAGASPEGLVLGRQRGDVSVLGNQAPDPPEVRNPRAALRSGGPARLQAVSAPRGAGPGAARGAQVAPRANVAPLPSRADAASRCPAPVCASCSSTRTELDSEKSIPRAHAGAQQIRSPPTAWAAAAASEKTGRGFRSRQREPDRARPILGQRDRPPPHPEGARGQTFRPLRS